jgi:hypothetical protein
MKAPADNCSFPGCALADFHAGEHVPHFRFVMRLPFPAGSCGVGNCVLRATVTYADSTNRPLHICDACEHDLITQGLTELARERAA